MGKNLQHNVGMVIQYKYIKFYTFIMLEFYLVSIEGNEYENI